MNNDPASSTLPPGSRLLKGSNTRTRTHTHTVVRTATCVSADAGYTDAVMKLVYDNDDDDDDGVVRATHCGLQQAVVLAEITQLPRAARLHPQVIPVGGVLLRATTRHLALASHIKWQLYAG